MEKKTRREKNTEYQRTYAKNHPERRRQSNKAYYEKNKDVLAKKQKVRQEDRKLNPTATMLKEHRKSLGWSQQKYAAALDVTQATLSMWERGLVPVNMEAVSRAFPELAANIKMQEEKGEAKL